ncbi:uncharacterized protein C3orf84 homolog isoform X2 [Rhinatrema bivittatum]|uniref:uncharacterized protein C3orf84 homolog isoform X2 n=1 Tax=Rhinatrema bivittatum TaxID=194408 RepID=UPI00112E406F|nr:uncharacterized protein C3orf84 homolog isoform X2 [Rhinatrema bivittatum]
MASIVTVGSKHPTGFYGHFRTRIRNDFKQEYRHEARPQPPRVFIQRMKENPAKHAFSRHDNRYMFSTVCAPGLGKRRFPVKSSLDLIDWLTLQDELKKARPLVSTYRLDFLEQEVNDKDTTRNIRIPQLLVPRVPQLALKHHPASTTYRYNFRNILPEERPNRFQVLRGPTFNDTSSVNNSESQKPFLPELQKPWAAPWKDVNSPSSSKSPKSPLTELQKACITTSKDANSTSSSKSPKPQLAELQRVLTTPCKDVNSPSKRSSQLSLTELQRAWSLAVEQPTVSDCLFWPESVL